ncbi:MAG: transcriptional regulator, TetR family [Bacilli bacterium]|nr:transcriptional regulator, TetR family [Bacilli bacterium]
MNKQKLTKRKEQSIQTKQNIYDVALELMKNKSFKDVTIDEISKKAGVSVGSFYYYFSSKEDIYTSLLQKMDEELFGGFDFKDHEGAAVQAVLSFFNQLARYLTELGLNITTYILFSPETIFYRKDLHMNTVLEKIIKAGQTNGELAADMSEKEMADYLLVIVRGVVIDWCMNNGGFSLEETMQKHMKRVVRSISES